MYSLYGWRPGPDLPALSGAAVRLELVLKELASITYSSRHNRRHDGRIGEDRKMPVQLKLAYFKILFPELLEGMAFGRQT